jgi:sulfur carrier protein
MIKIKVNGDIKEIKENQTLNYLLLGLGFNLKIKGLAIALNWEIVHREKWNLTYLQEGDLIELVKPVQGG